jgi:hypothetical protein
VPYPQSCNHAGVLCLIVGGPKRQRPAAHAQLQQRSSSSSSSSSKHQASRRGVKLSLLLGHYRTQVYPVDQHTLPPSLVSSHFLTVKLTNTCNFTLHTLNVHCAQLRQHKLWLTRSPVSLSVMA